MERLRRPQNKKLLGFTLLEALLVLAMLSIVLGISAPIYHNVQVKTALDTQASIVAGTLRRAQTLASTMNNDSAWGVLINNNSIILFSGLSYATRNTNFDEIFDLPTTVWPSASTEIIFGKNTGLPNSSSTFILYSANNDNRTISVNAWGAINY